ncbi:MAG: hypothetical protein R3C44_01020 [Chloroflexota bacterium]
MRSKRFWVGLRLGILFVLMLLIIAPDWPAFGDRGYQLDNIVHEDRRFDFLTWEMDAFETKARAVVGGSQDYLSAQERKEQVLAYLDDVGQAQSLQAGIDSVFSDPSVADPQAATADKQAELDALRDDLAQRQPTVEAIVQEQVSAVLADEGFDIAGSTFPPVLMNMTPLPYMLIVSPRDRIEQIDYATLVPDISTDEKDEMETAVYDDLDLSALVVPIGGLGIYPAMIRETSNINWLAEVVSHEWTHHWLAFRPLGVRYLQDRDMRTINETVASLVQQEIGPEVIARYYPEYVPPPVDDQEAVPLPQQEPEPPAFDYSAELSKTREHVDALLAEGKIDEAETYMEQRRQEFWDNGYQIRKINQAFFAFYGGYAAEPGGAAGQDPIGPMLREIRAASPSLHAFVEAVSRVTSFEDLQAVYRDVVGGDPAAALS